MKLAVVTIDGSQWLSDEIDDEAAATLKSSLVTESYEPLAVAINGMTHYFNRSHVIVAGLVDG